ncbi:MAG TPA: LuxR C-terminal-related transcriptional regulator [Candidatus Dormibacteraeota bacterium]|jgi:DNA-binding CsgD family transcriptional regulator/pimeloyl-ACP methyl ester carboxylesterase
MRREGAGADQRIFFLDHGGGRVAYAILGAGPVLMCDLGRLHHLDVFWRYPPYRRLVEALGRRFTVLRWDRPGCGLSERARGDFTLEGELALFDRLLAVVGAERLPVLAAASSAPVMMTVAARRPERVSRLAVFGAWTQARPELVGYRGALDGLLRSRFPLAVDVLAQATGSGCDAKAVRWLAGAYRQVASGDVIAKWLAETVRMDVRDTLARVRCPTLVLHRRDDPSSNLQQARDVAAGIRDAVLVAVDGTEGVIWEGDVQALVGPLTGFLSASAPDPGPAEAPETGITEREREVAGLVALGMTNADIAERLGIGRRTVESHLERLRSKLGLATRTELAAWSSRMRR